MFIFLVSWIDVASCAGSGESFNFVVFGTESEREVLLPSPPALPSMINSFANSFS